MNINEKIKNNMLIVYKNIKKTLKLISESKDKNNKIYATEFEHYVISGDDMKDKCCKNKKNIKSVDAITYNQKEEFRFIEFKIQKKFPSNILKDVDYKMKCSLKCFQHNIDKNKDIHFQDIKRYFIFKLRNESHRNWSKNKDIEKRLTSSIFSIHIMEAKTFDANIEDFKMHNYFNDLK